MKDDQDNYWYEELFDAVFQFLGILDLEGKVVKVNQSALELTGLSRASTIGRRLWEIPSLACTSENRRALKQAVLKAVRGDFVRIELEIQSEKIIDFTLKPILDKGQAVSFVIAEGRDVSIDKKTRAALYQSQARFSTIYEKAGIGIVIKDPEGRIIDCNPAFRNMLGFTSKEIKEFDYLEITHPDDRAINRKLFHEMMLGKLDSYNLIKRYINKPGKPVWVSVNASLVRGGDEQAQFAIIMAENITFQKESEAEVTELRQKTHACSRNGTAAGRPGFA